MYQIEATEKWFNDYTDSFKTNGKLEPLQQLKLKHSRRVQELSSAIVESLGWNEPNDAWLAHAAGLLHDTARFEQYRDYKTFQDSASFDHGDRGADILEREFDWSGIEDGDRRKVLEAVRQHNKLSVPTGLTLSVYRWCAVVRDADKIDVFRMVQHRMDNGTIYEMLPRHKQVEGLSPALVDEIRKTGLGSYANARSLQDYRLIQLTWALDLNYPVSVVTLKDEGIFDRIAQDLRPYGVGDIVDSLMKKIDGI